MPKRRLVSSSSQFHPRLHLDQAILKTRRCLFTVSLYYPLRIDGGSRSVLIDPTARLVRIDSPPVCKALGIGKAAGAAKHGQSGITIPGDSTYAHWLSYFQSGDPNVRVAAFLSTHLLVVDKPETAELAVCAMKLLRSTRWTPYIGFSEPKLGVLPDVYYSHPCPYWGGEPISLRGSVLVDMRRLFAAIRRGQSREKDRTLRAMFLYAESHDVPSYSLRYFQHCTILEVLFLPQRVTELSYRFQLRIAKWF